jgi:hypothetical protein
VSALQLAGAAVLTFNAALATAFAVANPALERGERLACGAYAFACLLLVGELLL